MPHRAAQWRNRPHPTMTLAGIPVSRELVRKLAHLADEPTGGKLARALENETRILALEIEDRELLLRALEDWPDGLAQLRATLLEEHVGRKRDGL